MNVSPTGIVPYREAERKKIEMSDKIIYTVDVGYTDHEFTCNEEAMFFAETALLACVDKCPAVRITLTRADERKEEDDSDE